MVLPKSGKRRPLGTAAEMYKRRNEVERLFRRLKGFCRVFSCFAKLDAVLLVFALIVDALRSGNTP